MIHPNRETQTTLQGSHAAMIRAARRAAELARQHNQPLLLWRDGQIIRIMPDDLPDLADPASPPNPQLP